jgi:hypothetical protein
MPIEFPFEIFRLLKFLDFFIKILYKCYKKCFKKIIKIKKYKNIKKILSEDPG